MQWDDLQDNSGMLYQKCISMTVTPTQSSVILVEPSSRGLSSEHNLQLPNGEVVDIERCLTLADIFELALPH